MARDYSICVGTAGWGVFSSRDGGETWVRHTAPFPLNSRVQVLVPHPAEPNTIYAGGDTGLYMSRDSGAHWERVGQQGDLPTIWSLAIDPVEPSTLFAGTRPSAVYRSRDGGWHWERLKVDIATLCPIGETFVTNVLVDPDDHRQVWAGVEIDGLFHSHDGGDTWRRVTSGPVDPDIHGVAIASTSPKRMWVSTAQEVFLSSDMGESWESMGVERRLPLPYCRCVVVKPDQPQVLYASFGQHTTGVTGQPSTHRGLGQDVGDPGDA